MRKCLDEKSESLDIGVVELMLNDNFFFLANHIQLGEVVPSVHRTVFHKYPMSKLATRNLEADTGFYHLINLSLGCATVCLHSCTFVRWAEICLKLSSTT